uniref:Uncharacterized protein n=1 Tax=Mycena chlorophos TaxID=658473 RepID=A0ABQ0LKF8_MYCCL|nr:predicted protein [Mycena chlorophos]
MYAVCRTRPANLSFTHSSSYPKMALVSKISGFFQRSRNNRGSAPAADQNQHTLLAGTVAGQLQSQPVENNEQQRKKANRTFRIYQRGPKVLPKQAEPGSTLPQCNFPLAPGWQLNQTIGGSSGTELRKPSEPPLPQSARWPPAPAAPIHGADTADDPVSFLIAASRSSLIVPSPQELGAQIISNFTDFVHYWDAEGWEGTTSNLGRRNVEIQALLNAEDPTYEDMQRLRWLLALNDSVLESSVKLNEMRQKGWGRGY